MSRMRQGRRTLAALVLLVVASCLATLDRAGSAEEVQALNEAQLADPALTLDTVVLRWTATGDDGLNGRATRYDLRYSSQGITGTDTLGWWNAATRVSLWNKIPALPGMPDSVRVLGFTPGYRYYAMLRTCDEIPNWSPYSNLAIIEATDLTAPKAVLDLRVRR
jgi:hypothetical protein